MKTLLLLALLLAGQGGRTAGQLAPAYAPIGVELPCTECSAAVEVLTVQQMLALEGPEFQASYSPAGTK